MYISYPACFYGEDGGYSVFLPDWGSATCGENTNDAIAMAVDLLAGLIYAAQQDREPLPTASAMKDVDPAAVYREMTGGEDCTGEMFTTLVAVDVEDYARKHFTKAVKKTLTVPAWLNDQATAAGINFSQTLQNALKEQLHISD